MQVLHDAGVPLASITATATVAFALTFLDGGRVTTTALIFLAVQHFPHLIICGRSPNKQVGHASGPTGREAAPPVPLPTVVFKVHVKLWYAELHWKACVLIGCVCVATNCQGISLMPRQSAFTPIASSAKLNATRLGHACMQLSVVALLLLR